MSHDVGHSQPWKYFLAGQVAGMAGVVAGQPLDVVKVKLQTQRKKFYYDISPAYRGVKDCVIKVYQKSGLSGFYRGLSSPLLAVGLQKSVAFGVFGVSRAFLQGDAPHPTLLQTFVAGLCGGFANSFILCPVDQLKIAQQVRSSTSPPKSLWTSLWSLTRKHKGIVNATFGAYPAVVMRELLGFSVYFTTFEAASQFLLRSDHSPAVCKHHANITKFLIGGFTGNQLIFRQRVWTCACE